MFSQVSVDLNTDVRCKCLGQPIARVRPAIGHVRYINILTWLRGFKGKLLYLVMFSLYPILSTRKTRRRRHRFTPCRNAKWDRKFPEFPNFQEKRTTSRGGPKFSRRIFGNFLFYYSILSRNFRKFGRMEHALSSRFPGSRGAFHSTKIFGNSRLESLLT